MMAGGATKRDGTELALTEKLNEPSSLSLVRCLFRFYLLLKFIWHLEHSGV